MVWVLIYFYIVLCEVIIMFYLDFFDVIIIGGGYVGIEVVMVVVCMG